MEIAASTGLVRGLEQVSVDHEVGQREILREPAIAYARPVPTNTQALGPRDENFVNADVQFLGVNQDTLLILASDGLTDNNLLGTLANSLVTPSWFKSQPGARVSDLVIWESVQWS